MSVEHDFPAAEPHGAFQAIADGVWFVGGTIRMNRGMTISRNMFVVRCGDELTLINPIRLSKSGEAELESLGTVRHMMLNELAKIVEIFGVHLRGSVAGIVDLIDPP